MPQLGRFTLRDEGRTIAVGKVLRYKPAKEQLAVAAVSSLKKGGEEEKKQEGAKAAPIKDDVYDMDSGEMLSREEYNKRQKERADLAGVDEEDEDDEDGKAGT